MHAVCGGLWGTPVLARPYRSRFFFNNLGVCSGGLCTALSGAAGAWGGARSRKTTFAKDARADRDETRLGSVKTIDHRRAKTGGDCRDSCAARVRCDSRARCLRLEYRYITKG